MINYFTSKEQKLSDEFVNNGYIIRKIENIESLEWIKNFYLKSINNILDVNNKDSDLLNNFHKYIKVKDLNEFRLKLISSINKSNFFRKNYYNVASEYLQILVGNELVMQRNINLSIQLPNDSSSLLDMHADTWSGDSPYEVVVWLPLVDCYKSKSMYILKSKKYDKFLKNFELHHTKKNFNLFKSIKKDLTWLNVNFGEVLIFNQCLPHGNIINKINETRWTNNCRFKSIFTPYGDKKIGEFFQPITLRAASKIGMEYKFPLKNDQ